MVNDERFKGTRVLELIGNHDRAGHRMASERKNLVAQYARTEMRKSSFANRVTEPWNSLPVPTKLKNARDSKAFRRMRKKAK
jgi:hypothetical protein